MLLRGLLHAARPGACCIGREAPRPDACCIGPLHRLIWACCLQQGLLQQGLLHAAHACCFIFRYACFVGRFGPAAQTCCLGWRRHAAAWCIGRVVSARLGG